jgi:ABC-type antimicrobial peptide transport system permease subunit
VEQRTHEIGIRMALGANQGKIMQMVLGQSMRLAVIGTVVGLAFAFLVTWLLGGLLAALLFKVKSADPLAYSTVVVILAAVALLAAFIPARRATRVDPILALRQE